MTTAPEYYICDLRPEFRSNPFITFWRAKNSGYAYPLEWAGKYDAATVIEGGTYYTARHGRSLIRFAVPCAVADSIATKPPARMIDGDAGPVVINNATNRRILRAAALRMRNA